MLLFKPYHVFPIVRPALPFTSTDPLDQVRKVQTRRIWTKARAKTGSIHQCRTRMFSGKGDYFAKVEIVDIYEQPLGEMTEVAAEEEGGYTLSEYQRVLEAIGGKPWNPLEGVFVVEMKCTEVNISTDDLGKYRSMYRSHMQALRGAC